MRKFSILTVTLFLFVFSVFSKQRSQDEAIKLVESFLQKQPSVAFRAPMALNSLNLIYTGKSENNKTVNTPVFYVYNVGDNNGFVIISGDDRAKTILGYSDNGSFDYKTAPDNFKSWLNFYKHELEILSVTPESASAHQISDESIIAQKSKSSTNAVAPLLGNIKYNQDSPYNDLCPLLPPANTVRAATGCVATAMSQVMKYHQWPVTGVGSNSYTTETLHIPLSQDFSTTNYDWANMLDTYNASSTQAQKNAVATLIYHCGVAADMDYNAESGTSDYGMAKALINNFSYDPDLQLVFRNYYTRAEWVTILKTELDATRPILYGGSSSSGGHQFVCDGYDANEMFHFNWGWGGSSNGYFEITALAPGTVGIGGGNGSGYNSNQSILIGVQKSDGISAPTHVLHTNKPFTTSVASTGSRTGTFDVTIYQFFNIGVNAFAGEVGFALYSGSTLVKVINQENMSLGIKDGFSNTSFSDISIPSEVTDGTYKMYMVYKATAETNWHIVRGLIGTANYVNTTVTSTDVQFAAPTATLPNLTMNSLSKTGNLYQNKTGKFNINITNTGGEYNSKLVVNLTSTSPASAPSYVFTAKASTTATQDVITNAANIAANETVNLNYSGKITVAPGDYTLSVLYDSDNDPSTANNVVLGTPVVVTVLAEPTASPVLSLTQTISFPNNMSVPKTNATLTAHINNSVGYFDNKLIAFIYPSGGGSSLTSLGYQAAIIDAGETITVTFSGNINLAAGDYKIDVNYMSGSDWVSLTPDENNYISFTLADPVPTNTEKINLEYLHAYPNPAIDRVSFNTENIINSVKILDLSGREIIVLNPMKKGEITIPIENLGKGVYILQADSKTIKFIKK